MTTHLDIAKKCLDTIDNSTNTNPKYFLSKMKRCQAEALISIAESLEELASCVSGGQFVTSEAV